MSTAGTQRVTRAASKARSTGAASTGAASVGASSVGRSRRGGSRRGDPAVPLTEDDKPTVGNQVTRAYGTEGQSAEAQFLSAQIALNQAINPIANAVSKARASETPVADTSARLPALSEEPEPGEHGSQPLIDPTPHSVPRRPYSIDSSPGEPPAQPSFSRYFWAPRHGGFNSDGRNRTSNDFVANSTQRHVNESNEPHINGFAPGPYRIEHPRSWPLLVRDVVFILMLLFGLLSYYEANRSSIFTSVDGSEVFKGRSVASQKFQLFNYRLTKVEERVDDISLNLQPSDATPELQINWFNPGFGAGIDLYLSSPTLSKCDPTWIPSGWPLSIFKKQSCPEIVLSAPQLEVLTKWDDPVNDAWCAPPSNGKLQLTVVLPRTIATTELVIEHASMNEMPVGSMGSAPKEVELWIHIPDDITRAAVLDAIDHMHPSLLEESSPQNKAIGDQALPSGYVRVGRWDYDIWTKQRIQTFLVPFSLEGFGVSTNKVAIRINSNWGNQPFTCLNRLRLHGADMSGVVENLEDGPVQKAAM